MATSWVSPAASQSSSQQGKGLVGAAALAAFLIAVAAFVAYQWLSPGKSEGISPLVPASEAPPDIPPQDHQHSFEDLLAAVCRIGTWHDGTGVLRDADASGNCISAQGGVPILVGQSQSDFTLRNIAARFHGASYAITPPSTSGGRALFLSPVPNSVDALAPLREFGMLILLS